eukprot:12064553-Ditylum_brightwellii.AAC.1
MEAAQGITSENMEVAQANNNTRDETHDDKNDYDGGTGVFEEAIGKIMPTESETKEEKKGEEESVPNTQIKPEMENTAGVAGNDITPSTDSIKQAKATPCKEKK